ncbi:MAG: two-component system response regulator ArcA, partial [Alkalimonas sp.]|nr:two-component system response regulator ArcA [Alkalimonas sp.]
MQTPVVLIVEDEEVTRLNLVSLFQGEGYDVIEAVNGDEMNQRLEDSKVNLIVM